MKYISLIVLVAVLYVTWNVSRRSGDISEYKQTEIQRSLQTIIADYIQKNVPNVTQITFKKFWTEALSKQEVKATFVYSFLDNDTAKGATEVEVTGTAMLKKAKADAAEGDPWTLTDLNITGNSLEYKDPVNIHKDAATEPAEAAAPPAQDATVTK